MIDPETMEIPCTALWNQVADKNIFVGLDSAGQIVFLNSMIARWYNDLWKTVIQETNPNNDTQFVLNQKDIDSYHKTFSSQFELLRNGHASNEKYSKKEIRQFYSLAYYMLSALDRENTPAFDLYKQIGGFPDASAAHAGIDKDKKAIEEGLRALGINNVDYQHLDAQTIRGMIPDINGFLNSHGRGGGARTP
jgi:hypothetical protein